VTSERLVEMNHARMAAYEDTGPGINADIHVNPNADVEAAHVDARRHPGNVNGEYANFIAIGMPTGYSSLGGFGFNPYDPRVDPRTTPPFNDGRPVLQTGGSSSDSGIGVNANLTPIAIGTETSGSILSPANANGSSASSRPWVWSAATASFPSPQIRTRRDPSRVQ